jgi:broad specificity phosphatase PhoE
MNRPKDKFQGSHLSNVRKPAFQAHSHWAEEPPTRMLFLRHGETDWNIVRRIQGWKGTSLNALGLRQARLAAGRLKGWKFDGVVSSDLKRARQTAHAVADPAKLPVHSWLEARERCFGEWEGKSIEQVLKQFKLGPGQRADPFLSFNPKGGETMAQFAARTRRLLDRLEKEYKGKTVLVVTHGGPVRIAACLAVGIPCEKYFLLGRPGNTSLTLIESQGGVRWLNFYNDMSHLEK